MQNKDSQETTERDVMLHYKEDWEQAKKRIEAWYHGEVIDRCAIWVEAPRANTVPRDIPRPKALLERWTNIDYVLEKAEETMRCKFYGGEAFPHFLPNLGPDVFSAWLGCPLIFNDDHSTWSKPIIGDWEAFDGFNFDPDNKWWRWINQATRLAAERGKNKFIVGLTDIHGGADSLAALRGPETFCMDLILHPGKVKECEKFLRQMWFEVYEKLYEAQKSAGQEGSYGFLGWGPGKTAPLQEDMLALISPKMFEEYFLEAIIEQTEYMDYSMFHLDGPESLPHLELLLDIPKLNGIQWQPGDAHYPITQWIPLLKRIQDRNKCILITATAHEIETLLGELSPAGLMIGTACDSEDEAKALLGKVARWTT